MNPSLAVLVRFARTRNQALFAVVHAMRDGREPFALHHAVLPLGRDDAHALHTLYGVQEVDAARERPPAIAERLERRHPMNPRLLRDRRNVTAHPPARNLESEQRHPVLEARQIDELTAPRIRIGVAFEHLPRAPHAPWIEAGNDDMSFR